MIYTMNKNRFYIVITFTLVAINGLLLSWLIFKKPQRPEGEGPKALIIEKLRFDKTQIKAYELLIQNHRREIKTHEVLLNQAKQNLYEQLTTPTTELDTLYEIIAREHSNIEQIHFHHFEDIKKLCRPEQIAHFEALSKELTFLFSPKHPIKK